MRTTAALAIAIAFISFAPTIATPASRTPQLRLLSLTPITVHGLNFHPRESVHINVLRPNGQHRLVVNTSPTGTFTARFTNLTVDRCTNLQLQATGAYGDHALLKTRPLCPPP
jgi:hypothetical protein